MSRPTLYSLFRCFTIGILFNILLHAVTFSQWQLGFSDDFNRADGPLVSPWSLIQDTLFINNNQVNARPNRYGLMKYGSLSDSAYSVQLSVDFNFANDINNGRFQFFIAGNPVEGYGAGYIAKISRSEVMLYSVLPESIIDTSLFSFSSNQKYTAILKNDASTDSVYILIKNSSGSIIFSLVKPSPRRYFYIFTAVGIENSTETTKYLDNVVFERNNTTDVKQDYLPNLLSGFALHQNYPNPFNPITKIQYSIPSTQFVSLKIYDILGNEIATVVNEHKQAGIHEVDFNGHNLSTGVYYYRMRADSYSENRKFVLIK